MIDFFNEVLTKPLTIGSDVYRGGITDKSRESTLSKGQIFTMDSKGESSKTSSVDSTKAESSKSNNLHGNIPDSKKLPFPVSIEDY